MCSYFPVVIALVTDRTSKTEYIGGTGHETTIKETYQKVGSKGMYLCNSCQVRSWIARWTENYLALIVPLLILLLDYFFLSDSEFSGQFQGLEIEVIRNLVLGLSWLVLAVGGFLSLLFAFPYFFRFKYCSYEEVR